ncbi:hypothetical protein D3C79_580060 [compost metagenome]
MQGILHQALHAVDFTAQAFAQLRSISVTFAGHTQAAQGGTQFMRQVAQQLLLQGDRALQALSHVIEGTPQFAQLVLATGGTAGHPRRQLIRTPGIGLLAQLDQGHDQHAVEAYTQQQREHARNDAIGHELPEQTVLSGHQALWQLDHQQPLLWMLHKRHAHPWQADHPSADRPVDAP